MKHACWEHSGCSHVEEHTHELERGGRNDCPPLLGDHSQEPGCTGSQWGCRSQHCHSCRKSTRTLRGWDKKCVRHKRCSWGMKHSQGNFHGWGRNKQSHSCIHSWGSGEHSCGWHRIHRKG